MHLILTSIRPRRRPTWLGWLLIATAILTLGFAAFSNLYPFLSPESPPQKGLMVVEGWIHDLALNDAVKLFKCGDYEKIVCTGVPIETGSYIQQFKSYPEMTAQRLRKMGIPEEQIIVTIADSAKKDRTYRSAEALREALIAHNLPQTDLHLISVGAHGRRSRMLFQKALGIEYNVGITCLPPSAYEPEDWYKCSEGVREVIGESIAYLYAKLFFHP
ncbi:ElyC/SanA/YdcF family protein [Pontiella agarivorans]|uniref:ElyC/SanA/YdcF family protein n=1 Tax=Pontiella agarivorans TaxID=3038953 RepID=A0ABU5MZM2_9BACT|nr:ElyC/SanA/YdcF family protein [Pontiella agarivorans]MDZ8119411.1 ElyC/SanA/YdcF family protein [Pontiella agarivorans]